jgi:hypothetical protein
MAGSALSTRRLALSGPAARVTLATTVGLLLVTAIALSPARDARADDASRGYIPMVASVMAPPVDSGPGAFFLTDGTAWTERSDIAIDAAGGHHVIFAGYEGLTPVSPVKPVYYAYCPPTADCSVDANWDMVGLALPADPGANQWMDVELAVAGGRVAFIAYADTWPAITPRTLVYAECTANCTAGASSWRGFAALDDPENTNFAGRSFALDPSGYPHLVYHADDADFDDVLHYASCEAADCSDGAYWTDVAIQPDPDYNFFENEYLTFTADGKARLATTYSGSIGTPDEDRGFTYWECDAACSASAANWSHVHLYPEDDPLGFALSPTGQPRGLIYGSGYANYSPDIVPDTFSYVWCDGGCLDADNWHESTIGSPTGEAEDAVFPHQEARLAVDGAGRPYVVYYYGDAYNESNNGLHVYYCTGGCQADGNNYANWHRELVETTTSLEAAEPIDAAYPYVSTIWQYVGRFPRIAFDAAGNVRLVYGNTHWQLGWDTNNHIVHHEDLVVARLKLLERP